MLTEKRVNILEEARTQIHSYIRTYKLSQEQLTSYLEMSPDKKTEFLRSVKSKTK